MRYEAINKRITRIEYELSCEYLLEAEHQPAQRVNRLEEELLELEFELAGYHVGG
jgi:hypothetical protein